MAEIKIICRYLAFTPHQAVLAVQFEDRDSLDDGGWIWFFGMDVPNENWDGTVGFDPIEEH